MKSILFFSLILSGVLSIFGCSGSGEGCKAPCATNFDADAKVDNGDCKFSMPSEAVTINFRSSWLIDFATGKIDSSNYPCGMANYEDDMLLLTESSGGSAIHVYIAMQFFHKAKGDTSCNGPKYDMGGSWALISTQQEGDNQNWKTCEHSTANFEGRTGAIVAGTFFVLKTREGNFYKIYVEKILTNGGTPDGIRMTWVAAK